MWIRAWRLTGFSERRELCHTFRVQLINLLINLFYCSPWLSFSSVSGLPIFIKVPPSLATPVQGSTFQVTCQADGFPRPIINWTRVGMPLPAGKTNINQGTLTINNLSPADNGFYDCVVTNIMGTKKKRINLAVQVRPNYSGLYQKHHRHLPNLTRRLLWQFGIRHLHIPHNHLFGLLNFCITSAVNFSWLIQSPKRY